MKHRLRLYMLLLTLAALVCLCLHECQPKPLYASDTYTCGDTVKVAVSRSDTFYNGTNEVSQEVLKCYRWLGLVPDYRGDFTKVAIGDSGTAGFYWVSAVCDIGEYFATWDGTIQGRTPDAVYSFTIEATNTTADSLERALARLDSLERRLGIPSRTIADDIADVSTQVDTLIDGLITGAGPEVVNLWFFDSSDTSGIPSVSVRIKDEDQVTTLAILESNSSGKIVTALPADTAKVIASKLGSYTFTVPETIIVTASGLTDTIWGTAFDPGTPDSSDVTRIYGWCRDLSGSVMSDVIVTVRTMETYTDWGSPGTSPTLIVMRQAVRDTTDSNGKFSIDLICADQVIPEGGSTGNVRHVFEFSKPTYVGPRFVGESDTLYIPCTNQSYGYWNAALRP